MQVHGVNITKYGGGRAAFSVPKALLYSRFASDDAFPAEVTVRVEGVGDCDDFTAKPTSQSSFTLRVPAKHRLCAHKGSMCSLRFAAGEPGGAGGHVLIVRVATASPGSSPTAPAAAALAGAPAAVGPGKAAEGAEAGVQPTDAAGMVSGLAEPPAKKVRAQLAAAAAAGFP